MQRIGRFLLLFLFNLLVARENEIHYGIFKCNKNAKWAVGWAFMSAICYFDASMANETLTMSRSNGNDSLEKSTSLIAPELCLAVLSKHTST